MVQNTVYEDGNVCISILVSQIISCLDRKLMTPQHPPGEDQYGYEDSGERWLPIHTVESIVRYLLYHFYSLLMYTYSQLLSVISLLSSDKPNTDSPANVDAAKEVRENFAGTTCDL